MKLNDLNKKDISHINESIALYQKAILEDINLTLRVITKDKTYITKLIDWPGERFIFAAPLDKLDWVLFERDKIIKVSFITKKAIFSANVQVMNKYRKNEVLYYSGVIISPLIKQQQRQYFRLDVLLELSYKLLPIDDEPYIIDDLPITKATSVNISIGGMNLVSAEQLHKGNKILISLDFMHTSLEILGQVLFLGEKNAVGNYSHRINFLNIDNNMQNTLSRLIFERQRLLMIKTKASLT